MSRTSCLDSGCYYSLGGVVVVVPAAEFDSLLHRRSEIPYLYHHNCGGVAGLNSVPIADYALLA